MGESSGRSGKTNLDLVVLGIVSLLVAYLAIHFDFLESLVELAHQYEEYEIDEIFTVMMVMSFGVGIFAWRRVLELRNEIRQRREIEARVRHLAMHDPLTGLANRHLLMIELQRELARAQRGEGRVALFVLDLDKFKEVNDVHGHATGDALLRAAADRMRNLVRQTDLIARLGGDEFVIIQADDNQPVAAQALATRIVNELAHPYDLRGRHFAISVSVGVAVTDKDLNNCDDLLHAADVALYRAKDDGRSTYRLYNITEDRRHREREALKRDLRDALDGRQLMLNFQPQFNNAGKTLTGFETLVRWRHPRRGVMAPSEFIPLAEQSGLIHSIGEWILTEACRAATQWPGALSVAVNVSPVQLRHRDFVEAVRTALKHTGLPPERLEIEVSESVLMSDGESALRVLGALKGMGVRSAMDDFGTGYSSLRNLHTFPFEKIKIDRMFIGDLGRSRHGKAITRAAIAMGSTLGLTTMAEGVETETQMRELLAEGCDHMQGFLLGVPMTGEQALTLALQGADDGGNPAFTFEPG